MTSSICRGGFLSSFILISYIAMTTSVMLDLTELKNKVSQLKVNPRGNLWATGHFMGKKSVDSSLLESVFENIDVPSEDRDTEQADNINLLPESNYLYKAPNRINTQLFLYLWMSSF
uniref:Neuromedin Bb n=1 Tax=Poecilia mexicana TaxID=48701 RepID=A0A3B3Y1B4_9TELE